MFQEKNMLGVMREITINLSCDLQLDSFYFMPRMSRSVSSLFPPCWCGLASVEDVMSGIT